MRGARKGLAPRRRGASSRVHTIAVLLEDKGAESHHAQGVAGSSAFAAGSRREPRRARRGRRRLAVGAPPVPAADARAGRLEAVLVDLLDRRSTPRRGAPPAASSPRAGPRDARGRRLRARARAMRGVRPPVPGRGGPPASTRRAGGLVCRACGGAASVLLRRQPATGRKPGASARAGALERREPDEASAETVLALWSTARWPPTQAISEQLGVGSRRVQNGALRARKGQKSGRSGTWEGTVDVPSGAVSRLFGYLSYRFARSSDRLAKSGRCDGSYDIQSRAQEASVETKEPQFKPLGDVDRPRGARDHRDRLGRRAQGRLAARNPARVLPVHRVPGAHGRHPLLGNDRRDDQLGSSRTSETGRHLRPRPSSGSMVTPAASTRFASCARSASATHAARPTRTEARRAAARL